MSIMYIEDGIASCSSKQQTSEVIAIQSNLIYAMSAGRPTTKNLVGSQSRLEWLGIIVNTTQAIFILFGKPKEF